MLSEANHVLQVSLSSTQPRKDGGLLLQDAQLIKVFARCPESGHPKGTSPHALTRRHDSQRGLASLRGQGSARQSSWHLWDIRGQPWHLRYISGIIFRITNMTDARTYRWNIFDVTKVGPREHNPLTPLRNLVLSRDLSKEMANEVFLCICQRPNCDQRRGRQIT